MIFYTKTYIFVTYSMYVHACLHVCPYKNYANTGHVGPKREWSRSSTGRVVTLYETNNPSLVGTLKFRDSRNREKFKRSRKL